MSITPTSPAADPLPVSPPQPPAHPADGESFGELGPVLIVSFLLWIVITIAVGATI